MASRADLDRLQRNEQQRKVNNIFSKTYKDSVANKDDDDSDDSNDHDDDDTADDDNADNDKDHG